MRINNNKHSITHLYHVPLHVRDYLQAFTRPAYITSYTSTLRPKPQNRKRTSTMGSKHSKSPKASRDPYHALANQAASRINAQHPYG